MTTPVQLARREGYLHRVFVALDMLANVLLGGLPDETISARCARAAKHGSWLGKAMLAWLDKIQARHGQLAEEADLGRAEIVERLEQRSTALTAQTTH